MSKSFVFELGTEELPAKLVKNLRESFLDLAETEFTKHRIEYEQINSYSTPRRLVLYGEGFSETQADREQSIKGPSVNIAFENGEPTKAGLGFAKSQNMAVDELIEKDGYLYAEKIIEGEPTGEVLARLLPEIVNRIPQPQKMRWGDNDYRFIRPIRWIVALLGSELIQFELAGLNSGNISRGHRFLGSDNIKIDSAEHYFELLNEEFVIVKQSQRKNMITDQLNEQLLPGQNVYKPGNLLEEVVNLVEYPASFRGEFKEDYLDLPAEVLITSMIEHQRYFPVKKGDELTPYFLAVRNGNYDHIKQVKNGNEMVIRARLADAKFFFEEDLSKELNHFKNKLNSIVYQEELGSLADKVERITEVSANIADLISLNNDIKGFLLRAAELSKFDLATDMVKEFASLQGVMGSEYAKLAGENKRVAQAIREHYLPAGSEDSLPQLPESMILSIADKIDDIVSNFHLGNKPTGSHDPFALRRKGTAIIKIILKGDINLELSDLIRISGNKLNISEETFQEVKSFFSQRLRNYFLDKNIRYDVLEAAMDVDFDDINNLAERTRAIMKFRDKDFTGFVQLFHGLQRCQNLAAQSQSKDNIDPKLIKEPEVQALFSSYQKIKAKLGIFLKAGEYYQALEELSNIKSAVDNFLDNVVVMVDDQEIKKNRVTLLKKVAELILPIMDINAIVLDEE
ncbi:MAG: glycine--tRNA ligase subunit beta [Bacillota bacterium]